MPSAASNHPSQIVNANSTPTTGPNKEFIVPSMTASKPITPSTTQTMAADQSTGRCIIDEGQFAAAQKTMVSTANSTPAGRSQ